MNTVKAVVFDLDGTLLDTERLSYEAWKEAERITGWAISDAFIYSIIGCNRAVYTERLEELLSSRERAEAFLEIGNAHYQESIEHKGLTVKAGVFELLKRLQQRGIRVALATSSERKKALLKLERSGLGGVFDPITCGCEVLKSKPEPDIYLRTADRLQLGVESCLVIEDSPNGVRAGVAAGMRTVLVPDLAPISEEIRTLATWVCADLNEVSERLGLGIVSV